MSLDDALPGMWEEADLIGGETDMDLSLEELAEIRAKLIDDLTR